MRFYLSFLIVCFGFVPLAVAGDAPSAACDRWTLPAKPAKKVILLTHGLNLNPERMDNLAGAFVRAGFAVYRPAFSGHCGENEKHLYVKAADWDQDARRFYAEAKRKADSLHVPLVLVAYSFSAVVFQVLSDALPFSQRVYFAPALETHFWYPLVVWFAGFWPSLTYHTMVPEGYYANAVSGQRSVLALNEFFLRWQKGEGKADKAPALLWGDPGDELVHVPHLKSFADAKPGWKFAELSIAGSTLKKKYHHLIIDQASLGKKEWERVLDETLKFLRAQ